MSAAKVVATSAVAVMVDVVAVADPMADRKAAPAVKPGRKVVQMVALKAVAASAVSAALSRAVSSATINGLRAKSSASHAHRVSHVNPEKAAAKSVRAVNVVSAVNEAVSSAHRWMPPSKTLPWPTKQRWQQRWVVQPWKLAKKPHAANVVNVVVSAVAAMTAVVNHAMSPVLNNAKRVKTSPMQRPPGQQLART